MSNDQGGYCPGPYVTARQGGESNKRYAGSTQNLNPDCTSCYTAFSLIDSDIDLFAKPKVRIDEFEAAGLSSGNTNLPINVKVEVNPNNTPITLTLATRTGSGAAQFTSNGGTTLTITQTTNVEIKGTTVSSTKDNMRLEAKLGERSLDTEDFTVISVTLSLRFSNNDTVSLDNNARTVQQNAVGTLQLGGPFLSSGTTSQILWRHVIEIVGTVLPSSYSDPIVLRREIIATRTYNENNVLVGNAGCDPPVPTPCDDTSLSNFRDDDPQSNNSNGTVYDLDSPGSNLMPTSSIGTIRRRRTNFRQWATVSQLQAGQTADVRVSSDIEWFQRISVEKMRGNVQISNAVSNDNQAGAGATPLSWNLQ
jgi:hypothetical protein